MIEKPLIGVLALQGAFEEHQACLEAVGCRSVQVRTPADLENIDAIVLPGGESTAMGLIGTTTGLATNNNNKQQQKMNMWTCLQDFASKKPVWGTCAGMILLADRCIGTSAVIEDGQALIGGMNITVCRNYFGSQISSFEMPVPAPPTTISSDDNTTTTNTNTTPFPGVFIRAPAILAVGNDVEVLGRIVATPCRQAAVTLNELERKIASGEDVIKFSVADALERNGQLRYKVLVESTNDDKKEVIGNNKKDEDPNNITISLPGAADGTNAREVVCAVRKGNLLCTAFHPELTNDYRWHEYFVQIVNESKRH